MRITSPRRAGLLAAAVTGLLLLGACGQASGEPDASASTADELTIETNLGEVTVPHNPERVVVLDNTAMETVRDLGIEPVALPKPLLPDQGFEEWLADDAILDVGSHREPNLEVISEAQPDLIIGGYRFNEYTEELSTIAPLIDIAPSDESPDGYVEALRTQTTTLGEIFDASEEAEALVAQFDTAVQDAAAATDGESVFLAVASGNIIDNGAGRIGRVIEPLELRDVFASEDLDSDSVHQDSGLAPETVAQADPDWMIVLDRDAATSAAAEATPARQLVTAQEAWTDTTFMTADQVIYLDPYFYTREGIQAYTETYEQIAEAFGA